MEYLVRWKGYGAQDNVWYPETELDNARELVDDFLKIMKPAVVHPRTTIKQIEKKL